MFKNETTANTIFRATRGFKRRLRGKLYSLTGAIKVKNGSCLYVGSGFRLIGSKFIQLSNSCAFGINARLEAHAIDHKSPKLMIGENSRFGDYCHIGTTGQIKIGSSVLGGSNILIIDHNHGNVAEYLKTKESSPPNMRVIVNTGNISIGDNVWIADNVIILGNTVIGQGSIVAAGTIVKEGVYPPFSLIK